MVTTTLTCAQWMPLLTVLEAQTYHAINVQPPANLSVWAKYSVIIQRSQQYHLPVQYLGAMPIFAQHRVYRGDRYDWVLVNSTEDPLMHDAGGFPIPDNVRQQLGRIQSAGLQFDAIFVAHEVPHGTVSNQWPIDIAALTPPPPRTVQKLSSQLGNVSRTLWTLATLPLVAVGGAILAAAALVDAAIGLDPILLGVVVGENRLPIPGEPAAWFYLTHWAYNQEASL